MATKTGIELTKSPEGWQAPCGCVFHIFDGPPSVEKQVFEKLLDGSHETILIGVVAPHWHPCKKHGTAP